MPGRPLVVAALALVLASIGCTSDRLAGPTSPQTLDVRLPLAAGDALLGLSTTDSTASSGYTTVTMELVPCPGPTWYPVSTTKLIGPEGGVVDRGPFTLTIPPGALPDTQRVRLTRPVGNYLTVQATVGDSGHYQFAQAVDFAVNVTQYCPGVTSDMLASLLGVWMDAPGGAEGMVWNRQVINGTIKFTTDHFSSYGIAW
jgi:hypothetical protein